jgi:predicted metal-dependent hydrolase
MTAIPLVSSAAAAVPPPADIPHRQLDLDFDPAAVPADWYLHDGYLSTFLDALSLLFPEGERYFVDAVKRSRADVASPALRAQIAGFIAQEATHGKEHRAFNELFAAHGLVDAPRLEAELRVLLDRARRLPPRARLAVTCALEHITAILAAMLLGSEDVRAAMHPTVRPLWVWHALEETEHKAVAFDVYQGVGGGYILRTSMMLMTTLVFFAVLARVHVCFLSSRRLLWRPWRWMRGLAHMWIKPGVFRPLVPAYLDYFRPRFHPDDRDSTALVATWRQRLFGEGGELRGHLRDAVRGAGAA